MFNKKIIFGVAIVGFVLGIAFSTNAVVCPGGAWDSSTGVCIPTNTGLPDGGGGNDPVPNIITNVMLWLLRIIGVIAVIAFVVSGIQYLTSAGNESQIETAKRNMLWSIVGVIVALSGLVILGFIDNMLSEGSYGNTSGGGSGGSGGQASSAQNPSGAWINPDTGLPYNSGNSGNNNDASVNRGESIVNSAINNNATTVPNSPLNTTGLPIENN